MKIFKRSIPLSIACLIILTLSQCSEDNLSFGETHTGFIADSIYQANSDGFLSVQYSSTINFGSIQGYIYSDNTEDPATVVGMVSLVPGSTVMPIRRKNYWKVTSLCLWRCFNFMDPNSIVAVNSELFILVLSPQPPPLIHFL